jgi:hypothetical protein
MPDIAVHTYELPDGADRYDATGTHQERLVTADYQIDLSKLT